MNIVILYVTCSILVQNAKTSCGCCCLFFLWQQAACAKHAPKIPTCFAIRFVSNRQSLCVDRHRKPDSLDFYVSRECHKKLDLLNYRRLILIASQIGVVAASQIFCPCVPVLVLIGVGRSRDFDWLRDFDFRIVRTESLFCCPE